MAQALQLLAEIDQIGVTSVFAQDHLRRLFDLRPVRCVEKNPGGSIPCPSRDWIAFQQDQQFREVPLLFLGGNRKAQLPSNSRVTGEWECECL